MEIIDEMAKLGTEGYVFPGPKPKKPLSTMAMPMLLRRMKANVTVHGFRSTFRDWASETTGFSHEVCEMALAHTIGNKAEAAYRRGDLFEKRRKLMEARSEENTSELQTLLRKSYAVFCLKKQTRAN